MKHFLFITGFVIAFTNQYAQDCGNNLLAKGKKVKIELSTYPITLVALGPGILSMKQKEKDAKIAEHKANILSGKITPEKTYMDYEISNVNIVNDGVDYELSVVISGVKYSSYFACDKDNYYNYRAKGVQPSVYNNDTIGFGMLGTQIIPKSIKTGDVLPGYSDIGQSFPASEIKDTRIAFSETDYSSDWYSGKSTWTTTYGEVTSKVKYTTTMKYIKLYQAGTVMAEENITIGGNTFKSYLIGNEVWTKMDNTIDVKVEEQNYFNDPALSKRINKSFSRSFEKGGKRTATKINEMNGANDAGYVVSYQEIWFVPGIGAVKGITYDQFGNITGMSNIIAIE